MHHVLARLITQKWNFKTISYLQKVDGGKTVLQKTIFASHQVIIHHAWKIPIKNLWLLFIVTSLIQSKSKTFPFVSLLTLSWEINKLWSVLHKNGFQGQLLTWIKSMYNIEKDSCRSSLDRLCLTCLKQEEICSPVLFS